MILKQPQTSNFVFNDPILKNLGGFLGAIMGLLGTYFFTKKLFDKRPGVIIDENGITEYAGALSIGFIPWADISDISERSVQASVAAKQRFVTIGLVNPEAYIAKETNAFKRKMMSANAKSFGSPIHISTNGLKIKHEDLLQLMRENFKKYKHPA